MSYDISAGILTYRAPKTLGYTLETYKKAGLLELLDDVYVVSQLSDRQQEEKEVCERFAIRFVPLTDNGKMGSGFKSIYENAKHTNVLFLENDFIISAADCNNGDVKQETCAFFDNCVHFLKSYDVVRGRSRRNPGQPNYAYGLRNEPPPTFINHPHLAESIYWLSDPDEVYPSKITRIECAVPSYDDRWYTSTNSSCNYTNNPYICSKDFFRRVILPHAQFNTTIEDVLATEGVWSKSPETYKCVYGPGLFTHFRSHDGHY